MALAAIHLGEHLAEELMRLGMSAAELARKIRVSTNRVTQISKWKASDYGGYRSAPRPLFGHERRILVESAEPL